MKHFEYVLYVWNEEETFVSDESKELKLWLQCLYSPIFQTKQQRVWMVTNHFKFQYAQDLLVVK